VTAASAFLGWDIGGVNIKAARLETDSGAPRLRSVCLPYEIQREPQALGDRLRSVVQQLGATPDDPYGITMTAELSQAFRTKLEGVGFILDALEAAFPANRLHVYTVDGRFVSPREARRAPLTVAASNWAATANWVAQSVPTCLLIDIGTTSTDLIPIVEGKSAADGRTDPERLLTGELLYTGALRTPAEAVARKVPLWNREAAVSAEGFALMGDAHLWLGRLRSQDYTCPTPDRRPATREYAGERLARVVCADRDMLDDSAIDAIAAALAETQVRTITEALERLCRRRPEITTAVVTGLGDFIAAEAARAAGLAVIPLAERMGDAARTAPAAAVAWLLRQRIDGAGPAV
jgi:(4-(4-[2-(gamma-L-glutamylamino)ethyl]phenoxymethyl)furan-2-yl)methanamine synthase